MTSARGIPTSRAYWELKAEQMLNRVFSNETPIEVEIVEPTPLATAEPPASAATPLETPRRQQHQQQSGRKRSAHAIAELLQRRPELVPISIAGAALLTAVVTVVVAGLLGSQQQALRQERNLVLLERLRAMGPASGNGASEPGPTAAADAAGELPPPPDEPWMEELAQLPAGGAPAAEVLKVPFSAGITNRAPSAPPPVPGSSAGGGDGVPLLVGVVQVPGRSGSAIFQVGGSSTSAAVGESIGGSGWRLRSASGDSAVIERGGQVRRISISSGF
ncbi:MAG: hypothetical protein ACO24U_09625 [Prochlorococcaceae cyanobacterium]